MKKNNSGFSLVELIIVIAIMAILSAALAPQLMKYINKSRVATDNRTCQTIYTCVNAALTNDKVWHDMTFYRDRKFKFYIKLNESTDKIIIAGLLVNDDSATELRYQLSGLKNPKQSGMNSYMVVVDVIQTGHTELDGTVETVPSIGDIEVSTSAYDFNHDIEGAIFVN